MRTSYIERMSVADRKIALRVYFDKLGKNYNDYVPEEDKKKRNVENDLYYPVRKHNISFSETLGQIFPSSKYADFTKFFKSYISRNTRFSSSNMPKISI